MSRPDTLVSRSKRAGTALAAAAPLASLVCLGCSSGGGLMRTSEPSSPVVAEVNGRVITLAELDAEIAPKIYDIRTEALDEMVGDLILETEAENRGVRAEELIELEVDNLGDVRDEEIAAFFEENRDRMRPDETIENISPKIREFLQAQRRRDALENIREAASVTVSLERPRIEVEPLGPSLGADDATVTIVEFSDYQCPFCSRAEPVVKQVLEKYPNDVRLVFRHMPLDQIHPEARGAAVAAVCADEQQQFWPFHDQLFENQQSLASADLTRIATELELDLEAFDTCRNSDEAKAVVRADLSAGKRAGATGTPAFYVNGVKLSGAQPLAAFVEVIERELGR